MERTELIRLVKGAQAGDSTAIEDLFAAFYNDVYYFAIKTVKDEDLACDITQEAFVEVFRTIGSLKEPAAFVKWMKEITYHQCTRYFRKKKEVLVDEDEEGFTVFDTLADESTESLPAEVYENTEFRGTVMDIVNELTEEQRAAVLLRYFDDLSVKEIAAIQGVSEGTVKSRLNYARKALRKSVNDYEEKHNIKLHALGFLPLLHLAFGEASIPAAGLAAAKAAVLAAAGAAGAGAAAGGAGGAAAASAKTAGMGIGAKIAAMPVVTKIIAGVTAAAVALGGGWLVAKQVFHEDFNRDCYCDFCGEKHFAHLNSNGGDCFVCGELDGIEIPLDHHTHCYVCGELVGADDQDGDRICDICGEYSCGELHGLPHSYLDGVCYYCGIAEGQAESGTEAVVETEEEEQMPKFEYFDGYNGWGLELWSIHEKYGDNFGYMLDNWEYLVTADGTLMDVGYEEHTPVTAQEEVQQWFSIGNLLAYTGTDGEIRLVAPWREYLCEGLQGRIVYAHADSFGSGDKLLLEDAYIYTVDENGNLYLSRFMPLVVQEQLIEKQEAYLNHHIGIRDEETGHVINCVDDVVQICINDERGPFIRYAAEGMVYETTEHPSDSLRRRDVTPVKNTGVRTEDLISDLNIAQMIYKDTENNVIFINGNATEMPEGKTTEQIAGAWGAPMMSVVLFDDGSVYLYSSDGAAELKYNEELTLLYRDGKIEEFVVPHHYGFVSVKMDDGRLYAIITETDRGAGTY